MENTTGCGALHSCPNQFCSSGVAASPDTPWVPRQMPSVEAKYKTLVWSYEWPNTDEQQTQQTQQQHETALAQAARFVVELGCVHTVLGVSCDV